MPIPTYWTDERIQELIDYRNANPGLIWDEIGKHFGKSGEACRGAIKNHRRNNGEGGAVKLNNKKTPNLEILGGGPNDSNMSIRSNIANIHTIPQLLEFAKVDLCIWREKDPELRKWDVSGLDKDRDWITAGNTSLGCKLERIVKSDDQVYLETALEEIKKWAPNYKPFNIIIPEKNSVLSEISVTDLHLAKLACKEECGQDFDVDIAVNRYRQSIEHSLLHTSHYKVGRFFIPLGNDFYHSDNQEGATTKGTRLDVDTRHFKSFRIGTGLVIETIERLMQIAPVDVMIITGNHDKQTTFFMGEVLSAHFKHAKNVNIDNRPLSRKYYQYHKVGLSLTHGDECKIADLPLAFASEAPKMWGNTTFRVVQHGHIHKRKETRFNVVDTLMGTEVWAMPSLCSTDNWHAIKGFIKNIPMSITSIFSKEGGLESNIYGSVLNMESLRSG